MAFRIRNFLDLPPLLHPPKIQPQVDPHRFQRFDHCVTRKQWLSSVHSCRPKLYTGFPSDHYLLVSEVQVKLASRPKTAQQSRPDLHNCTEASKEAFQKSVTAALLQQPTTQHTDHTARVHYHTDGSGTAGRCTMKTPAGWGFCYVLEGVWHDAYGPVPTDPTHPLFAGAQVGSNNTGELTAILEALLHSIQAGRSNVTCHSDSEWSIKVLEGKWRPHRHKQLVNYIRAILRKHRGFKLEWVPESKGMREPTDWLIKAKLQQVDRVLLPLHSHVTTPPLIFTETSVWYSRKKRRNILRLPESLDVSLGLPKPRSRCWQKPGPPRRKTRRTPS